MKTAIGILITLILTGCSEYSAEIINYGIAMLNKHRKKVLEIDRSPMDQWHQRMYSSEMGAEKFNDFIRRQYWFAYPGLLRLALELEFGEAYEAFADARDGV
nr:hypothetical protein [uncultured Pseudomonas sp.]